MIEEIDIEPAVKTQEDLAELEEKEDQFPDALPSRIFRHSVKITCEGKLKALFLKAKDNRLPIRESHYKPALTTLDVPWKKFPWRPAKNCGRPMIKQLRIGGDYTFGFLPPRMREASKKEDYLRPGTRDTLFDNLMLAPLVQDLEKVMRVYLPGYYEFHMYQAMKLVRPPDEVLVKNPWKVGDPFQREQLAKMKAMGYAHVLGTRAFSTLTLNRNLLFGMHGDGHNMPYTLSCLTTLGKFVGGELCFPRLGIGFDVQPFDVLISDTNNEYHCSSRIFVGKRISIVAYLHSGVDRGWRMLLDQRGRCVGLKQDKSLRGSIDSWMAQNSHIWNPVESSVPRFGG